MANINIKDIKPAGTDLFADHESFMHELGTEEMMGIVGGKIWPLYNTKGQIISYVSDK